jgi:toxin ParE1/3/4
VTLSHVTKTVQAARDLDEIWFHIALDNIGAADRLLDAIDENCHLLARQPLMGRGRPELALDLRSLPVARYVIFYLPSAHGIHVVRVLHGARDLPAIAEDGGFTAEHG